MIEYFPLTGALSPYLAGVSSRMPSGAAPGVAGSGTGSGVGAAAGSSEPPPPPSPLALSLTETGAQQLQQYYACGLDWQHEARALVIGYLSAQGFAETVRALHAVPERDGALGARLEGIARRKSALLCAPYVSCFSLSHSYVFHFVWIRRSWPLLPALIGHSLFIAHWCSLLLCTLLPQSSRLN